VKQLEQMLPKHRISPLQSLCQTPPSAERVSHIGSLSVFELGMRERKRTYWPKEKWQLKLAVILKDLGEGGGI
jgi:hypothetical protein